MHGWRAATRRAAATAATGGCHRRFVRPAVVPPTTPARWWSADGSSSGKGAGKDPEESPTWAWGWEPPEDAAQRPKLDPVFTLPRLDSDYKIPAVQGQLLSVEEVDQALTALGGQDVRAFQTHGRLHTVQHLVFCTGRSQTHLRRMAGMVVDALRARRLKSAPGFTGAEGEDDEDWMAIDCGNIIVNLFLADTRMHLGVDEHWATPEVEEIRPVATDAEFDAEMERLSEKFPMPQDYDPIGDPLENEAMRKEIMATRIGRTVLGEEPAPPPPEPEVLPLPPEEQREPGRRMSRFRRRLAGRKGGLA